MPFEIEEGRGRLRLHGRWTVAEAAALGPGLEALQAGNAREFVLDATGVEALDLTGAWLLRATETRLRAAGARVTWLPARPGLLDFIDRTLVDDRTPPESDDAPLSVISNWSALTASVSRPER